MTSQVVLTGDAIDPFLALARSSILSVHPDLWITPLDDSLLQAMQNVVEDLYGHVHRVSDLASSLGRTMGMAVEDVERLAVVGILHDVGKVHIDPAVLAKPGPLDDLERDHMRRHPELGYAMIAERFDRRVSEAILYHHERYDGGGYPFGLAATEIPILSRVVLVADAFDAITNHRSYQPALSVEFAIDEITRNSGTQFDPNVVEAFLLVADRGVLPGQTNATRLGIEAG
jgi:HD-GYP domain-containing protein (c-di-GMP phosphodiesterase class II)